MERCDAGLSFWIVRSGAHENANAPHPLGRRLRARRERPGGSRAAEQRDELAAPHHSITSSASNCIELGTERPSALAVLTLITNSNFVDRCTGRSPGFSPLTIRPV